MKMYWLGNAAAQQAAAAANIRAMSTDHSALNPSHSRSSLESGKISKYALWKN
jgi:hypothetical protein